MKIEAMMKTLRRGVVRLKKAEKRGDLETIRKRLALAMQLVEVAMLATAATKGLRVGKAVKYRTKTVKRRSKK
jgi:hypothetical protein